MRIYSHDMRMYVSVTLSGDVTLECHGVMFAGLGIRNAIRHVCACVTAAGLRRARGSRTALDRARFGGERSRAFRWWRRRAWYFQP